MDLDFCREIRLAELRQVEDLLREYLPSRGALLEIGAGSGWQARELDRLGYDVTAIDLAVSNYVESRVWPVIDYDGEHIPFPDDSFDAVFSSNVLEHIENYPRIDAEIARVLKPGGVAVHVVPSGTWRLWTNIAHYFSLVKIAFEFGARKLKATAEGASAVRSASNRPPEAAGAGTLARAFLPRRHGVQGNVLSEIFFFSAGRWRRVFENSGWQVRAAAHNHLFYTGRFVLGARLPIGRRRRLAPLFGSSCHLFVLSKEKDRHGFNCHEETGP